MASLLEHPRWGLNATQPVCFFCARALPKFAFLGGYISQPTPRRMSLDYDPCPQCIEDQAGRVLLIECQSTPLYEAQPQVGGNAVFPTGTFMMLVNDRDKLREAFSEDAADYLIKSGRAYIETETFQKIAEKYHASRECEEVPDAARV